MADLQEPTGDRGPAESVAPRSRLESTIAHIWEEILGVDSVGVTDNFFRLGGESLLSVQMLAAVEEVLLVPVDFVDFVGDPTVAAIAAAVERRRGRADAVEPVLEHGSAGGSTPCAFAQERLWFIEQMQGPTGVYNMPIGVRLRGGLDEDALERSLRELVRRHAALRTTFGAEDGGPVQVVAPELDVPLERRDLRSHPDAEAEAQRLVDDLAAQPFDLEHGPLLRALLLRLADEEHVLELVSHHIVCDGWSYVVAFRELGVLYEAFSRGESPSLPEPSIQYPDYARWERSRLDGAQLDAKIAHWRERLDGIPVALELPTDRPRPPVPSYRGGTHRSHLSVETADRIRSFARAAGTTPFATLLAVFDALLFRYSGQETIVVGATSAGRDRVEFENAFGLFASTVALRADLSGELCFGDLVSHVRDVVLDAIAHQDVPFERLVAELQPERDLSRHPIFQVFFAQVPLTPLELAESAEPFDASPTMARFDLTLWVEEEADGLDLVWEYSADLFDRSTIERLERHFLRVLEAGLADPAQKLADLPLLDDAERRQAAETWGGRGLDYPVACLHELFEAQAARTPAAVAVTFEGASLTYADLNERANRLAHRLRGLGVRQETLVALCLERSLELVVAVLAVLKAGGAYVPLDPEYPSERLAFVLEDTRAPVLLTQEQLLERLPPHDAQVVCIDRDAELLAAESAADPTPLAGPESLAYVIYTSGSTGKPKGVQVEHRNVARLFSATDEWFGFGAGDAWTLLHSYAFDFSVWELWGALLYGGRLVIAPHWTTRSPQALAELVRDEGVTVLNATPSLFLTVQDELLDVGEALALRYVVFGGEALQPAALRPWFERFGDGGPALVNMYGITETTVHVTYRPLAAEDCEREQSPVGIPIQDLQVYLLDQRLNPVPPGVAGELFVGGAGVARGYLNRPELTAERFLENPFAPGRLYRSGDQGRLLADGSLEFLGRIDDQVKIRGFRIELGEIQAALSEHEGVAESAVIAFEAAPGDVRLAAYAVPDAEAAGAVRRLVRLQRERRLDPDEVLELADGTAIATADRAATELEYEQLVVQRRCLDKGVVIPDDACVLDVGAGIGLFSAHVTQLAPGARVLAFEARPAEYELLAVNAEIHGLQAFDWAPAAAPGRTISDVIREQALEWIDLIRVDVPGGELEVLSTLSDDDWPKVRQVVVEVGAGGARLHGVTGLLARHEFAVTVEEDEPGLYGVHARRGAVAAATPPDRHTWHSAEQLRRDVWSYLEERLPGFMVPASVTLIDELPLTANGKLDRKALAPPAWRKEREGDFVAARTPTEAIVAQLWEQILGIERVGADDNFFHLGGHSLLAARVVTQIRERLSIDLSVRALFERPTLATFAERVDEATRSAAGGAAPADPEAEARAAAADRAAYPLSFPQQQLLFFDELTPGSATYNAALGVHVAGVLDIEALRDALTAVFERHEALRTVLVWGEAAPQQVVLESWSIELPVVDLSHLRDGEQERELQRLMVEHGRRPFDLGRDLMLRTTIFRLAPEEHIVLFQPHHVAFDAWAVEVFFHELGELYAARRAGRAPVLPELARQYRDFALWQRERLSGELLDEEIAFWRSQLAGAPTVLALPTDRPRPPLQSFEGASHVVRLSKEVAGGVHALSRAQGATPYMLLLAAFGTLLYRFTGQDDILVGGPMANRGRAEFEKLIGFFANTVVVRLRLAGNPAFAALLDDVRETALRTYEHQQAPLEQVVDAVRPQRYPGVNPLFQVNFRARVGSPPALELSGATTKRIPVDLGFARFDLALDLQVDDEGVEAEFIYNTDLFDRPTIERLAADFEALLGQVLARPDTRLLSLDLPGERPEADGTDSQGRGIRRFRESGRSRAAPG